MSKDKPTPEQVAWVFEKIIENKNQNGSFRKLIYDLMGYNQSDYHILYQYGIAVNNMILSEDGEITNEELAINIKRIMRKRKVNIDYLIKITELSRPAISNILNGKSCPKTSTLLKISNALNIDINKLLLRLPKLED